MKSVMQKLAFETLRWCIAKGGIEVQKRIEEQLAQPIKFRTDSYPLQAIPELGIPEQTQRQNMIQKGINQVILPSLKSLLNENAIMEHV